MTWDTIINDLQADAAARLLSEPFFDEIVILEQNKGVTESDVEIALGTQNTETGKKKGAVVIALMPEFTRNEAEAPGPELSARLQFQVLTVPLLNMAADGTGKTAERIATNILNVLHLYFTGLVRITLSADDQPILPLDTDDGLVSYMVRLRCTLALRRRNKVATPSATVAANLLTLTCSTVGAAIHYTTDGTYPGPENPTATLYTVPFAITNGLEVRAGATLADYIPSNTTYWGIGPLSILAETSDFITTESGDKLGGEDLGLGD